MDGICLIYFQACVSYFIIQSYRVMNTSLFRLPNTRKIKFFDKLSKLFFFSILLVSSFNVSAQGILFDFDTAPSSTSLPLDLTAGGITAHFSATGSGYSIQNANVLGFTPAGFSGQCLYPNSVFLADLLIRFDQTLTDFSILYACQELGCDDAATMRVTAYLNGNYVGTNTRTATFPGTYPTDTLSCSFVSGFDSVVVHYDSHPPLCQDYGVIYLADNMIVTPLQVDVPDIDFIIQNLKISPNPTLGTAIISFTISREEEFSLDIYDLHGRIVSTIFSGIANCGKHHFILDSYNLQMTSGVYFVATKTISSFHTYKLVVVQ